MMPALYLSIGAVVGAAVTWCFAQWWQRQSRRDPIRKHPRGMEERVPYRLNPSVLTNAEEPCFRALQDLVPEGYSVHVKVRLADLLQVTYGAGDRGEARARLAGKGVDFLVCDSGLAPKLALTLESSVADRAELYAREFVAKVCAKAGLPLVRLPVSIAYTAADLRLLLQQQGVALGQTVNSHRSAAALSCAS